MKHHVLKDMPSLRKRLHLIDAKRLERLQEAKDNKDLRKVIKLWSEEKLNQHKKILDDKQRMAIYLMVDFVHNFSYKWIAARLGISESILHQWRNDPIFIRELDREITRRRSFIRVHAFRNVHRAIMRGDMKATWNYLKMTGDLKENLEVVDRTGEKELDEQQLNAEIEKLEAQLATGPNPSQN